MTLIYEICWKYFNEIQYHVATELYNALVSCNLHPKHVFQKIINFHRLCMLWKLRDFIEIVPSYSNKNLIL